MAEDGKIVYKVVLDDTGVENEAESAGDRAGEAFSSGIGDKLKTGAKAVGKAAVAVGTAAVAAGSAIIKATGDLAEYGDHVDKMSQKLGMSAEAYQEWDAILQHSGASIDSLEPTMKSLFQAAQKGSEAFTALGMSTEEVASMSQEDLFAATITALQGVEDETTRTALAQELLGRGAQDLGALLNTSAEETEAMRERVHELGGVMSTEAVEAAANYQDTMQDMKTAVQGMGRSLISQFLPDVTTVMSGITELFSGNKEKGIGLITKGLEDLLDNMTDLLPDFLNLGIDLILSFLHGIIGNLDKILQAGVNLIIQLAVGLIQAIPDLLAMLPQIIKAILDAFFNTDWASIGAAIVSGIWEGIKSLWNSLVEAVTGAVTNLWQQAKAALGIASPSKKFKYIGEMTTEGTIEGIEDTEAEMTRTVTDVYGGLTDTATSALSRDMGSFEREVSYNMTATGSTPDMTIVVPLTLDGREIARATAWSMGEQLAWEEL